MLLNLTSNLTTNSTHLDASMGGQGAPGPGGGGASPIFHTPMDIVSFTLCVIGFIANILSVVATANIPHGLTTHSKLIISLGISDALIAASAGMFDFLPASSDCTMKLQKSLLDTAILATLTNLLAMAIDHYIAIMKPMHYHQLMSRAHGNCSILIIWIISLFAGCLEMIIIVIMEAKSEIKCNIKFELDVEMFILGFILFVLLVIIVIYTKIYFVVKQLVLRDNTLIQDTMHNYKAIVTTFLIIGTFVFCWLPSCIFQITMLIKLDVDKQNVIDNFEMYLLFHKIFIIFLVSNTLCDPIIYAIRLKEVQNGYRRMLYKCFPRYRQIRNEEEFRNSNQRANSWIRRSTISTTIIDNNGYNEHKLSESDGSTHYTSPSSTYEHLMLTQDHSADHDENEKSNLNNNSHT